MAVGLQVTMAEVNQATGTIARSMFNVVQSIRQVKAYLDATPDADLIAMGFTSGDVANIKTAFTDLNALCNVFEGSATRSPAYDHRTFAKRLIGLGIY